MYSLLLFMVEHMYLNSLFYYYSKRVEAQLNDLTQKSEAKKNEVGKHCDKQNVRLNLGFNAMPFYFIMKIDWSITNAISTISS